MKERVLKTHTQSHARTNARPKTAFICVRNLAKALDSETAMRPSSVRWSFWALSDKASSLPRVYIGSGRRLTEHGVRLNIRQLPGRRCAGMTRSVLYCTCVRIGRTANFGAFSCHVEGIYGVLRMGRG